MTTNPFKEREKKAEGNLKETGGDAEFEKVAASLTPDAEFVGNVEDVSAAEAAGAPAPAPQTFQVTDELSAKVVRGLFYPLAHYNCGGLGHPAWAVTVDESMRVAPPVTDLLQEYADKWLPEFLSKFGEKHSKLLGALMALSGLAAQKIILIRELNALEAQRFAEKQKAEAEARAQESREAA